MMLPKGWVNTGLLEIVELHDNRRIPLNQSERTAKPGHYPYYGANGQVDTVGEYLFEGEHILLAEDGGYFDRPHRGVAYEVDGKFWVNNHAHILSALGNIPASFIRRALNCVDWMKFVSGTTRLKLTQAGMQRIQLPLPPLAEQRRIVAKLDMLTARIARARTELDRVPVLVAHLKKSALDAAFRGDLSEDQRPEEHERSSQPELDDQERGIWQTESLPASWRWVGFTEFFDDVTDSKRKLPEKEYEVAGLYPIVDQGKNQIGGYTSRRDLVHPATESVIVFGDHTRCVKQVEPPFVQGADGVKVLAPAKGVNLTFGHYALLAVEIPNKGYSRHMKFVRKTIWPLPPLGEQAIIVERMNDVFARADRLEAEAARARTLLDRLESAILAKAFRGELVPQDDNDEPASVLLERIHAERAVAPKKTRAGRSSATS